MYGTSSVPILAKLENLKVAVLRDGHLACTVADRIRSAIPEPAEWQRIGNQVNAAFIAAWADFVNVLNRFHCEDHQQHAPLFLRDRQGTSMPSSRRVPQRQLLKVCASFGRFNHAARFAVKRAGIADDIGLDRHSPTAAGCGRNLKKKNRRTPSPGT